MQKYSNYLEEDELYDTIERTFDTCSTKREEIYWLICVLRNLLNIPCKRSEQNVDNLNIREMQLGLHGIFEKYKKKYYHSNHR